MVGDDRCQQVPLALTALAGGDRAVRASLAGTRAADLRAELARRAREDVDAAVAAVGPRAAAGWLVKQLAPPPPSGMAGGLAAPQARRDVVAELRRTGMSIGAIARRLRVGTATVAAALAATPNDQLPEWIRDSRGRPHPARHRRADPPPLLPADASDDDRAAAAWAMYGRGCSVRAIARALGVGRAKAARILASAESGDDR